MIRFYAPGLPDDPTLPEVESGHCVRVLRHSAGDMVEVVDGRGSVYSCRITDAHPRHTGLEILSVERVSLCWSNNITIAVAPTKNIDRMEWLVEKLVEVGVNRIIPLRCRFSERKDLKVERLEKIAVAAMKQSLKARMPEILPLTPFAKALELTAGGANRYIAYCDRSIPRLLFSREYIPGEDTVVFIGPEGDFSPEEIRAALDSGCIPVSLGDNRLRTETAALVACDTCQIVNQLKL